MKKNNRILLFIPMYNCESQIAQVLNQLNDNIVKYFTEVIIINNISNDNSEKVVLQFFEKNCTKLPMTLIRNNENYNLGGSHKVAFDYAIKNYFDYIIILHGDNQGSIEDFKSILENRLYEKYDCVLGSRFMKGSKTINYSKARIFGNKCFNLLFTIVTWKKISDLGSGLNIYKVNTLKSKYYVYFPNALYFNDIMILASCYYKHKILFYPISWREEGQISNNKLYSFSKALLKMLTKYIFLRGKYIESNMCPNIKKYEYEIIKRKEAQK